MWFAVISGLVMLVGGSAFVLVWWRLADRWADEDQKRFKDQREGPAPKVVRRGDVEG